MALHVTFSNIRVTHSSDEAVPLHVILRSPQAHIKDVVSPPGIVQPDRRVLAFPAWRARWEQKPPVATDVLHLCLRAVDRRTKWGRRRAAVIPFRSKEKRPAVLASATLSFAKLATGTVQRSIRIPAIFGEGFYDVSFDAVVEERRDIHLLLPSVTIDCEETLQSAYLVVAVNGRSVLAPERYVHVSSPTFDDVPPILIPRCSLAKLARCTISIRVHEAQQGNRCVGECVVPMHDAWAAVIRSDERTSFEGILKTRVDAENDNESVLQVRGSVRGHLVLQNVPRTAQMTEGVTTHNGMTSGRPVFCGAVLPAGDIVRSNADVLSLPHNWVQLLDCFGYVFYHNIATAQNSWVCPSNAYNHAEHDAILTQLGFEKLDNGLFRNTTTGVVTWVHPAAERVGTVNAGSMSEDAQSEISSVRHHAFTPNSTPGMHRQLTISSRSMSSSFSLPRAPSVPLPYELTLAESANNVEPTSSDDMEHVDSIKFDMGSPKGVAGASHNPSTRSLITGNKHANCDINGAPIEEYVTDLKWIRLKDRGDNQMIPGPATEGHTLTTVCNGRTVLKFGGKGSGGKINDVYAYDSDSMNWSTLRPLGAPPSARFGHGAVALGGDKSRLLVFGGSSGEGRLNDLTILNMEGLVWSPVHACGSPPEPRSRLGMCANDSGDLAMVFGGRTVYRFLGGTYFDVNHVNVFHAARSQWIQMTPRGSGTKPSPRSGAVVEFINGRQMLVHGGYDDGDRYFDDTWLFDLTSSTWQRTPYHGEPEELKARESHCSTVVGDDVLIYGGELERSGYSTELAAFDTQHLRWRRPSVWGYTPPGLVGAAMATVNDSSVLLTGGDTAYNVSREAYILGIERFETSKLDELRAKARNRDNDVCAICLDRPVSTMFVWCGHTVCCDRCAKKMRNGCPICRSPVATILYDI